MFEVTERSVWGPPVPRPRQVFAIGLNYRDHACEAQLEAPSTPPVFTKFPTSLTGHKCPVKLPAGSVDWEVELVAVIARRCDFVGSTQAWDHIAGLTVGQDLSERQLQLAGPAPQFSLGKSYRGFAPLGPELVTVDEFPDPDDVELGCRLEGGEILQKGRTCRPHLLGARSWWHTCRRCARCCRETSSSPARPQGSVPRATRRRF